MIFDPWDVALARLPFVERSRGKLRPVAIVSSSDYSASHDLIMAVMITSVSEGRWPSDHEIVDLASAGLKRTCFVRWKIATLSRAVVGRRLGSMSELDRTQLRTQMAAILPLKAAS